jgi:methionyl-tRNA formyltransferase
MRLLFAGTPEFAVPALDALLAARHTIAAVVTQPDRRAGRGLVPSASPIKRRAQEHMLPVLQPPTLKDDQVRTAMSELRPDAIVVVAYGLILPAAILDIPSYGALNIHASLLPRWRGAAPIQRALLAGDRETGISIMRMETGLDTGPLLLQARVSIDVHETGGMLHDKLARLGASLITETLAGVEGGTLTATPQPSAGITYAPKIDRAEARVDWKGEARAIERQIRAFNPVPGATTRLRGMEIKIWRSSVIGHASGPPGAIIGIDDEGVSVGCGVGALRLEEMQRAGGKRLSALEFIRGCPLSAGDRFAEDD